MLAKKLALSKFANQPSPFQKQEFPTLQQIALNEVAENFHLHSHLTGIGETLRDEIISKAAKNITVTITADTIPNESYWKAACDHRWKNSHRTIRIEEHGFSWKIAYMENHLEEYIKEIKDIEDAETKNQLISELKAVSPYVYKLKISSTLTNIDIGTITLYLPNLS